MAKAVAKVDGDQGSNVDKFIELAIEKGADLASLEKLMDLKDRHDKKVAEMAFNEAFSKFQKDKPQLIRDSRVSGSLKDGGTLEYQFASLPYIQKNIDPVLSKHGLSYYWSQEKKDDFLCVTCHLRHILGHEITDTLQAPADDSGKKNKVQAIGSTVSYLRRYTLSNITGVSADQDDDGGKPSQEEVNEAQLVQLMDLMAEVEWPSTEDGQKLKERAEQIVKNKEVRAYTKAIRNIKKMVPGTGEEAKS